MRLKTANFIVSHNDPVDLAKRPTKLKPLFRSSAEYEIFASRQKEELQRQHALFAAAQNQALLLVIQGMDAAGKDGVIKHLMGALNPLSCRIHSFKPPTNEEAAHDFLWRCSPHLPPLGAVSIFNRSYYEEVVVTRVHPELLEKEKIATKLSGDRKFWKERFHSINEFERHLVRNKTRIIKIFLHVSPAEQLRRFLGRLDAPEKNWKLQKSDVVERTFWNQYAVAYESCLSSTSHKPAPWFVVPGDDKEIARLIVAQIVLENLQALKLALPKIDARRRRELASMRKKLGK
jgi:PPK2 family polyphosphate:nucleotide phosphotransferase